MELARNDSNATLLPWSSHFDVPVNILPMPEGQKIFRLTTVGVGLTFNVFVLVIVSFSRQLRYPRHIFWAAVSLVDCFFLVQCVFETEIIAHEDSIICRIFVLFAGVDYSALLLFLFLAACDRYAAIAHYDWYTKKATNRAVILVLFGSFALTFIITASPFWTGFQSVAHCTVNLTHMHWVLVWNLLLGIACVALHIRIFFSSRAAIRMYPNFNQQQGPITLRFFNCARATTATRSQFDGREEIEMEYRGAQGLPQSHQAVADYLSANAEGTNAECLFSWFQSRSKVNQLEIRAALILSVNILPFWICTFPVTCNAISLYWCVRLGTDCSTTFAIYPYIGNLFLFHSIYNPLMYMLSSGEFRRALAHWIWKIKQIPRQSIPV